MPNTVALPPTSPAEVTGAVQFDLDSKITGRTYRIFISTPFAPPPPQGYPVITVLDADPSFAIAAGQSILRSLSGAEGALVVGVGYANPLASLMLRRRDLTAGPPLDSAAEVLRPTDPEAYGGAEDFHRFLTEELRPLIAGAYATDAAEQTLVGYSLSGLFAVQVLFTHPEAYRTVVAGSPSLYWRDREVLQHEAAFARRVEAGEIAPRVLITSAGLEQDPASYHVPPGPDREKILQEVVDAAMVDNARSLAERLQALKGAPGYQADYVVFAGETHNTGIPAAISRAVAFALKP